MAKNLVIVESPAKAKTIKKYLPKGYEVQATMGHVIDLPKSRIGIDIEDHFKPDYIKIRGKGELLKKIKKEANKADNILLTPTARARRFHGMWPTFWALTWIPNAGSSFMKLPRER